MNDDALRQGLRQTLDVWLQKLSCGGDVVQQHQHRQRFLQRMAASPICLANEESKEQHYEVPTEFFDLVLGPRMKYSCNLHDLESASDDLEEAELRSLGCICERAQIRDGMQVMDMGCGWGALTLYILQQFPNCHVMSVSNSASQRRRIEAAARAAGVESRLQVVTCNIADFSTARQFDRVVSVEMLEHMKNVAALLARVSEWLLPGGKLFTQILCHSRFAYNFDTRRGAGTEWMARNFFTGGSMFASDLFLQLQQHLLLEDMWLVNGRHYSRTLEAWLRRLDDNRDAARAVFESATSASSAEEQIRNWRIFFIFCSEVFAYDGGNQWLVAHHLFCGRRAAL